MTSTSPPPSTTPSRCPTEVDRRRELQEESDCGSEIRRRRNSPDADREHDEDLPEKTLLKDQKRRGQTDHDRRVHLAGARDRGRQTNKATNDEGDEPSIFLAVDREFVIRAVLTVTIFLLLWHGFLRLTDSIGLEHYLARWEREIKKKQGQGSCGVAAASNKKGTLMFNAKSGPTYRDAAKQLVAERPELAWVRDQRPTRFNLDPLLATTSSSTPAPPRPTPRATGTSSFGNIILDEVERVRRALSLTKIVHADLLIYEAGSLLGWHQDSFDRKRHLCTVVLELVRGGNGIEEQSFRPGTHVDSCAVSLHPSVSRMPPKPMPMEKVDGTKATSSRRDNENNDCTTSTGVENAPWNGIVADHRPARQEWCLIDRGSPSSKDGLDRPVLRHAGLHAEVWEVPADANLSIHGVAANNSLAHRFVCNASSANGNNSDPRICLVLFSWSEELAEQAQKQDLIVDMHKWWTEDLNQL
eukprot:g3615.t1